MNNSEIPTGITTFVNENYSYANSVIQSLGNLDCIKQLINRQNLQYLKNNPRFGLTTEFLKILIIINEVKKEPIIDDLINSFKQAYKNNQFNIKSPNVLSQDPFHFLYFLLQFIHLEINIDVDQNYNINNYNNQNVTNHKNDDYMLSLFLDFFTKTQNSFISNNFYNTNRNVYNCPNCGEYYFYSMATILRIDVESAFNYRNCLFPFKNGTNLDIDDIFRFFGTKEKVNCKFCNNSTEKFTEMFSPAHILIISLERNKHNFKNDIDFDEKININNYISKKVIEKQLQFNFNYKLKSCISYSSQINKYFANCYINGIWVRITDSKVEKLGSKNNLFEYEPQILIYECIEEDNLNNSSNSGYLNNPSLMTQSNIQNNNNNPQINQNNNNIQVNSNNMFSMNNNQNFNNNQIFQYNMNNNQFDINQNGNNIIQNNNDNNLNKNNFMMNFLKSVVSYNNNPQFQNNYNQQCQNNNNQQFQNNYNPQLQNNYNPRLQNNYNPQLQNMNQGF